MPVYQVELEFFRGPLDLLLYLVRRDELDVVDLPIAHIAKQFHQFIQVLEFLDLDLIGEFVVTASTLAEIKSRLILPTPEDEEPLEEVEEQDPRSDLIRQLLEYKRYKDAASALEDQAAEWQERYPRLSNDRPQAGKEPAADLIKEVELWDLVSALARVLEKKVIEEESRIRDDDTPISTYVERIGTMVREQGEVLFTSLFDDVNQRSKIVGIFLAILELLRHHQFRAEQSESFGEIVVRPPLADSDRDADRDELLESDSSDGENTSEKDGEAMDSSVEDSQPIDDQSPQESGGEFDQATDL